MIDANELRIGNYLYFGNTIIELSTINSDNTIRFFNENKTNTVGCFSLKGFNPIALTEEILLKCGFKEIYKSEYTHKFEYDIDVRIEFKLIPKMYFYFMGNILTEIKYLHQLQNIYWCLVGRELNVNL